MPIDTNDSWQMIWHRHLSDGSAR